MKNAPFRSMILAALLLLAGAGAASADLALKLEAKSDSFTLGEPVTLNASVTNTGKDPVKDIILLEPFYGEFMLQVSGGGAPFSGYLGPGWGLVDTMAWPKEIAPGQRLETTFTVLWNLVLPGSHNNLKRTFAFPNPGRYKLRARLQLMNRTIRSNEVEVEVSAPSKEETPVWKAMENTPALARFMQQPSMDLSKDDLAALQDLMARHPGARHVFYWKNALKARDSLGK